MRRILGTAAVGAVAAGSLIGLSAGTAHASTDCEGPGAPEQVTYIFRDANGDVTSIWVFACNEDGTARFVGGGQG